MERGQVFNMAEPIENVPSFDEIMGTVRAQNEVIVALKEQIKDLENRAGASEEKLTALAAQAKTQAETVRVVKSNVDLAYEKALEELGITPRKE